MRAANPITVVGADGKPLAGAKVEVKTRPGGSTATVFANETGGGAGANPATTDEHGRVTQWLERGAYTLLASGTGLSTYSVPWDAVPGNDAAVDHAFLAVTLQEHSDAVPGIEGNVATLLGVKPITDTLAKRPAASVFGRRFRASDTGVEYQDTGSVWVATDWPGRIAHVGNTSVLSGWLACDGSAVSRATFPLLFTAIGTAFGPGDGSTTFNVPDYRERVPVGGGGGFALAAKGGEVNHALSVGEMPPHSHAPAEGLFVVEGVSGPDHAATGGGSNWKFIGATSSAGGGASHNNMQPYTVCNVWIKHS